MNELSNAACRMSLRSSGAELDGGGGVKTPPLPSTPWKIQTTSTARVNLTLIPRLSNLQCRTYYYIHVSYAVYIFLLSVRYFVGMQFDMSLSPLLPSPLPLTHQIMDPLPHAQKWGVHAWQGTSQVILNRTMDDTMDKWGFDKFLRDHVM